MARGFVRAVYVTDRGERFWLYVDGDYVLDPGRGFTPLGSEALPPFPSYWRPRYVRGVDELGYTQSTRIGSTAANLWTGVQPTWFVEASDGTRVFATRTSRVGEVRR